MRPAGTVLNSLFQSQVAILGWGYQYALKLYSLSNPFQSQVAILGWGYRDVLGDLPRM